MQSVEHPDALTEGVGHIDTLLGDRAGHLWRLDQRGQVDQPRAVRALGKSASGEVPSETGLPRAARPNTDCLVDGYPSD
jgi:hypothetical protein